MHSTRYNCLIFQKTTTHRKDDVKTCTTLRGVYSSQKKADADLRRLGEQSREQLERLYGAAPQVSENPNQVSVTATGQQVVLLLLRVPQDVTVAVEV